MEEDDNYEVSKAKFPRFIIPRHDSVGDREGDRLTPVYKYPDAKSQLSKYATVTSWTCGSIVWFGFKMCTT